MSDRLKEIDFIKGIAIISVLFLHTLSSNVLKFTHNTIHIGQAVPLFIFATFYLSYKGLDITNNYFQYYYSLRRIKRLLKDVAIPFFFIVFFQFCIRIIFDEKPLVFTEFVWRLLGRGPGNYYFWVYLQLWMLIPFLFIIFNKAKYIGMMIVLIVNILLNVVIHNCDFPTELYRLSSLRYLFLSVPAFLLFDLEKQKTKNKKQKTKNKKQIDVIYIVIIYIYIINL